MSQWSLIPAANGEIRFWTGVVDHVVQWMCCFLNVFFVGVAAEICQTKGRGVTMLFKMRVCSYKVFHLGSS